MNVPRSISPAQNQPPRTRRLPKWLVIGLSVFGSFIVLIAIFAKTPETPGPASNVPAPAGSTVSASPTFSSPHPVVEVPSVESYQPPTSTVALPDYQPPAPAAPEKPAKAPAAGGTSYPNCAAVRAAGAAPLHIGEPGYSRKLDRDGDGIACE